MAGKFLRRVKTTDYYTLVGLRASYRGRSPQSLPHGRGGERLEQRSGLGWYRRQRVTVSAGAAAHS